MITGTLRQQLAGLYTLKGHKPIPAVDVIEWAHWMQGKARRVGRAIVGNIRVSTVFLGVDHQYGKGPPLLFETMCFLVDPAPDTEGLSKQEKRRRDIAYRDLEEEFGQERYSTWKQAMAGHKAMVERVRKGRSHEKEKASEGRQAEIRSGGR